MKQITLKPHKMVNYDELMTFVGFLKTTSNFVLADVYPYFETMGVELTNSRLNTMIYDFVANKKVLKRTAKHYRTKGRPQEYEVINHNLNILNIIEPKTLPFHSSEKVPAKEIVQPKEVETEMLTLDDVERIGNMDLAFIGYTIRTEMNVTLRKLEHSEELRAKVSEHYEKTKKDLELTKIRMEADLLKAVKKNEVFMRDIKELKKTIGTLNNSIKMNNTTIDNLQSELNGLRKRFGRTANGKGFKLGEVAKFSGDKPHHLRNS